MLGATGSGIERAWPERVGWYTKTAELRVRERERQGQGGN